MKLKQNECGLLLIDVQEKLFPYVENPCPALERMQLMIKGAELLSIPIVVTEQYPKGLEGTVKPLKELLPPDQTYFSKTVFSSWADDTIRRHIESLSKKQWILIGIEAHVCVQQTAMDMLEAGFEVVVVNDAISSRSIYDFSTGIADMRDQGVRISSAETVLFEIIRDSKHPQFKEFSKLIK